MSSEAKNGRRKVEAIVRLVQLSDRYTCSRHHPNRMRGDSEETSVISAGIREALIEVPVVCRKDMKVGLHLFAAASLETKPERIFARRSRHVMPSREPCSAALSDRHVEFKIFKQVQRESWSPGLWGRAYFSLLILLQLSDRPHCNVARYVSQDHKLMGVVTVQPVGVLRFNVRQDGGNEFGFRLLLKILLEGRFAEKREELGSIGN